MVMPIQVNKKSMDIYNEMSVRVKILKKMGPLDVMLLCYPLCYMLIVVLNVDFVSQ